MVEMHEGRASSRIKDIVDILVYAKTCFVDGTTLVERVEKEASARKVQCRKSSWRLSGGNKMVLRSM